MRYRIRYDDTAMNLNVKIKKWILNEKFDIITRIKEFTNI